MVWDQNEPFPGEMLVTTSSHHTILTGGNLKLAEGDMQGGRWQQDRAPSLLR